MKILYVEGVVQAYTYKPGQALDFNSDAFYDGPSGRCVLEF
jgi:hypothetical protein